MTIAMTKAVICLAAMMHGEARGEGDTGMLAVAHVALNRNAHDICKVVQAPLQFQGYDPTYTPTKHEITLARQAIDGDGPNVYDADHFVRIGTRAYWLVKYEVVAIIGHHEFLTRKVDNEAPQIPQISVRRVGLRVAELQSR